MCCECGWGEQIVVIITKAERADLEQILTLQHLAYQSEAKLLDDFSIPPLRQTIEEIEREYEEGLFLKAVDENGDLLGSVRAYTEQGTTHIGKLIICPEKQGQGIGTKLLLAIEEACPAGRYELFTSHKSIRTMGIYERVGYVRFKEQRVSDKLTLIFLEKYVD